ncbi:filamentous hemagglutinin outer membrane protein, partial [Mycobacteroides abscessus M94]
ELTSDPLAAPKMGIEQAKEFYNHPGEFIGKNLIHGTEALGGGAIGGEAAAGARGLLGDLSGTEGRAITHGLDDATPGHHTPTQVEHHTATGDHGTSGPHTPDLNHVSTESGGPGGWNQELNKPAPNTHYNVDDRFQYTTDEQRRVGHAEMTYDHGAEPGDRNGHQQRIAGGPDRLPGDQGGHIFGTQFGGPGEAINITAMRDTLNQVGARDYYNLEAQWRQLAEQGGQVQVKVDIAYPGDSLRPESYTVETYVDGKLNSTYHFDN